MQTLTWTSPALPGTIHRNEEKTTQQPVRVCFLIDELAKAGTESQLLALIRQVDRSRVQPYLCLLRGNSPDSRSLEPDDCPVYRLGIGSLLRSQTLVEAVRFVRFLQRERIDVIQTYFPDSGYFGLPLAWLAGVRQRIRTRNNLGHWMTPIHRFLGRLLNAFCTTNLTNCEAGRKAWLRSDSPDPNSVRVLENGVDLKRFSRIPVRHIRQHPPVVGVVANLRGVKGLDILLAAAARLSAEHPEVVFRVAGEGEQRAELEQVAARLGLQKRFQMVGSVADIPHFLAGVDIAVLCSRAEGMPNAVLEYMAASRPIVATTVGAVPELIEDNVHGLLVPPEDEQALTSALAQLLNDPERATQMGQAARARVEEHYSREAMIQRFENFYCQQATGAAEKEERTPVPRADVLTDIPGKPGRFWGTHTRCVGPTKPPAWLFRLLGRQWSYNLTGMAAGLRMFLLRGDARGVVTDGGASGTLFAWLQALCPWGRIPHVMVDCNWYRDANAWRAWLKGFRLRLAARSVHRFVVWASHEVEDYAQEFGLPIEKLQYVPFHSTLNDYQYEIRDDGYLFAGGNYDRDYRTLIDAVRAVDVPVWIATTRNEQLQGITIPPHVRVEGTSPTGFRQAMAAARIVVVPMEKGLLHSGGQQTCLNAMLLGKPTIAVGHRWATDFIRDGVNGLIVDYEDPQGLQRAIQWILDHPDAARVMGETAARDAAWFTTLRCMQTVYALATGADSTREELPTRVPVGQLRVA